MSRNGVTELSDSTCCHGNGQYACCTTLTGVYEFSGVHSWLLVDLEDFIKDSSDGMGRTKATPLVQ